LLALIVAIWPALKLTTGEPTITLYNYQQFAVFNNDPAPPGTRERLRLIFRGKEIPVTELSVTHFYLSNHTGKTVDIDDFVQPLSLMAANGVDVIYVRSYRQELTTAVAADWRRFDNNKWEMSPTVLNPEETLWIQLVYRVPDTLNLKAATDIFKWQALIKGAAFKVAPPINVESHWYNLQINHGGLSPYLLVATGLVFSFIAFLFHGSKSRQNMTNRSSVISLVALSALSWALAEIVVDVIYNQKLDQPLVGWVFVVLLTALSVGSVILGSNSSKEQAK
jgi:hypothetical protein